MKFPATDTMKALDAAFLDIFGYCLRPDPISAPEEIDQHENGENENEL